MGVYFEFDADGDANDGTIRAVDDATEDEIRQALGMDELTWNDFWKDLNSQLKAKAEDRISGYLADYGTKPDRTPWGDDFD